MSKHECCGGHDHEHAHTHDHGCGDDGCGCGHDHDLQTITLQTEEGEDLNCIVIGTFEVNEKEYIALLPEGGEDVFIYSFKEDGEEIELQRIESDEEYNEVGQVFMSIWGDDGEFEDSMEEEQE